MHRLVSPFILERYAAGEERGDLTAASLFVDIAGFSTLTRTLMEHGQHGAEVLATTIRALYAPLIEAVYAHDGFITVFAGDAFTALFPQRPGEADLAAATRRALAAAWAMRAAVIAHAAYATEYGTFVFGVKLGLAGGACHWELVRAEAGERATFYFRGPAVAAAAGAEQAAGKNTLVVTATAAAQLAGVLQTVPAGEHLRVLGVSGDLPAPGPVALPAVAGDQVTAFFPAELCAWQSDFREMTALFINLEADLPDVEVCRFAQTLLALQQRYGGVLNRIDFGDKGCNALLFWGAPAAYENDLARAGQFILDLQEHSPHALRAGLTRRIAYVGVIGSELHGEFTCHGDGVNLAARFMTGAPWDAIWLDAGVAQRVRREFVVTAAGAQPCKGFAEPQAVYVLEERQPFDLAGFFTTPFVGRAAELARLRAFVAPLAEGRSAGVLALEGEAGLGKSRLAAQFWLTLQAEAAAQGAVAPQLFTGQTDPITRSALAPFAYWLRGYFDQSPRHAEAHNKRAFNRQLDGLLADGADEALASTLSRGRSFLGALVGLHWPDSPYEQLHPEGRREWTFSALQALLLAESRRRPVLLLLEDAHWLDEESQAFLARLVRASAAYPLAILLTARPVVGDRPLLKDVPYARLPLAYLPAASLEEMVAGLLEAPLAPCLAELLEARAEGNPFFAEQLALYLREEEQIALTDGRWSLAAGACAAAALPVDVRVIFTARLDRLTAEVREVVQAAAVLGREFEVTVLSQMLQAERLEERLGVGTAETIWTALSAVRYIFKHALLRDAAYEMQLQARRRALHRLAAESLAQVYPEPTLRQRQELAYHYEMAYRLGEGEVRGAAVAALQAAGEATYAAGDPVGAAADFSRALDLLPDADREARYTLLLLREAAYDRQGDREGQAADLAALAALSAGEPAREAAVTLRRARLAYATGDYATCSSLAQAALPLAQVAGQVGPEAEAHNIWGWALRGQGAFREAGEHYVTARALAEAAGEQASLAVALRGLGNVTSDQGADAEAEAYYRQSLAICEALGDRLGVAGNLHNLGLLVSHQGLYATAAHYHEQSLALAEAVGDRRGVALNLVSLGELARRCGLYPAALHYYEQTRAIAEEIGNRGGVAVGLANLGQVALAQQAYPEAARYYEQALALAEAIGDRVNMAFALTGLAAAQGQLGQEAEAAAAAQQALSLQQELGQEKESMETQAVLAEVHLGLGEPAAALALVEELLAYLEGGGDFTGTEYELRNPLVCYRVLQAGGDPRATAVLRAAYEQLQRRAEQIADAEARQSFLHNVPWHAEILAAYAGEESPPSVAPRPAPVAEAVVAEVTPPPPVVSRVPEPVVAAPVVAVPPPPVVKAARKKKRKAKGKSKRRQPTTIINIHIERVDRIGKIELGAGAPETLPPWLRQLLESKGQNDAGV